MGACWCWCCCCCGPSAAPLAPAARRTCPRAASSCCGVWCGLIAAGSSPASFVGAVVGLCMGIGEGAAIGACGGLTGFAWATGRGTWLWRWWSRWGVWWGSAAASPCPWSRRSPLEGVFCGCRGGAQAAQTTTGSRRPPVARRATPVGPELTIHLGSTSAPPILKFVAMPASWLPVSCFSEANKQRRYRQIGRPKMGGRGRGGVSQYLHTTHY